MKLGLQLGCGPIHYPSTSEARWVNIDIEPSHQPDLVADYTDLRGYFEDNSVDFICSIHSFEHLPYPDGVVNALAECYRVLKPTGVLRLVVPDLELVAKAYVNGGDLKFIYGPDFRGYYHKPESRAERFHFFAAERAWQHQMCFDFELLKMLLDDAGFKFARRMPFGVSQLPELSGRDRFQSESISVEALKV